MRRVSFFAVHSLPACWEVGDSAFLTKSVRRLTAFAWLKLRPFAGRSQQLARNGVCTKLSGQGGKIIPSSRLVVHSSQARLIGMDTEPARQGHGLGRNDRHKASTLTEHS